MISSWLLFGGLSGWIIKLHRTIKLHDTKSMVGVGVLGGLIGGYAGINLVPGGGMDTYLGSMMLAVCVAIALVWVFVARHAMNEGDSKTVRQHMDYANGGHKAKWYITSEYVTAKEVQRTEGE